VRNRVAATFVLGEGERNAVIGFYTLLAVSVDIGAWPEHVAKRLLRHPAVPAALLGRLAIDRQLQGSGAREHLLSDGRPASQLARTLAAVRDQKQGAGA